MKKRFFLLVVSAFFLFVSNGNCAENFKKVHTNTSCECEKQSQTKNIEDNSKNSLCNQENKGNCDKCIIDNEDDEYCTYNQCFLDKHFREMKRVLCLTRRQENCIDKSYKTFKIDIEVLCVKYKNTRNELLKILECNLGCCKTQKAELNEIKRETRARIKEFDEEIKEQLCKSQLSHFKQFKRNEKRKFKKIAKYSVIYKFPCVNCTNCNK